MQKGKKMPNNIGEYIVPIYTWNDQQEAIDKGYTELIRCKDCKHYYGHMNYCDREIMAHDYFYCGDAERKEE